MANSGQKFVQQRMQREPERAFPIRGITRANGLPDDRSVSQKSPSMAFLRLRRESMALPAPATLLCWAVPGDTFTSTQDMLLQQLRLRAGPMPEPPSMLGP